MNMQQSSNKVIIIFKIIMNISSVKWSLEDQKELEELTHKR